MCLIAFQNAGSLTLAKSVLHNGWTNNPDGAGYMFAVDGKLHIRKPYFRFRQLWKDYKADHVAHGASSAFVLHFRWATHGVMDETNTHPHSLCGGRAGLVHNGVLPFDPPCGSGISDTVHFCRTVLAHRSPGHLTSEPFNSVLASIIGTANKLVLMDDAGNVSIVNEACGVWDTGVWFSNAGYLPTIRRTYSGLTSLDAYRDNWEAAFGGVTNSYDDEIGVHPAAQFDADAEDFDSLFADADMRAEYEAHLLAEERELDAAFERRIA